MHKCQAQVAQVVVQNECWELCACFEFLVWTFEPERRPLWWNMSFLCWLVEVVFSYLFDCLLMVFEMSWMVYILLHIPTLPRKLECWHLQCLLPSPCIAGMLLRFLFISCQFHRWMSCCHGQAMAPFADATCGPQSRQASCLGLAGVAYKLKLWEDW